MTFRWPRARYLAIFLALTVPLVAQEAAQPTGDEMPLRPEAREEALARLAPRYLDWLRSVRGLLTQPELDYFLRLEEDFRRDAFIRRFWEPRDPDPRTSRNELKERWEEFKDAPGGPPYGDPRFLLLLFNGPPGGWSLPDGRPVARCFSRSRELEIWFYGGSERTDRRFPVILLRRGPEVPYEVYLPGTTLRPMQRSGGFPTTDISQLCADDLLRYTLREISRIAGYDRLLRDVMAPLLPSAEWLADLASSATDLPRGAETFEVDVEIGFPARKQSRTAVRVRLTVPREEAPGRRFPEATGGPNDGELFHNFQLLGEVIRDGQLFESFRYRFEGPTPESAVAIPLGFTRYLRPGRADLRILLEDVYAGRYAQVVREIEVPGTAGLPPAPDVEAATRSAVPPLELLPPSGNVHVGQVRFRARASVELGAELDKVTFYLDDQPVLSKRRPPYSVELDLGPDPVPRRVRVVGFAGDREVATDQVWLNQGAQRFRVYLVEPRAGGIYPGGVTARVDVEAPVGATPERVELYLGEERVATFREPPFSHSLKLPDSEAAVVRAVAYLADGTSAEDVAVVGGAAFAETLEVQLVELPVVVTDGEGRPIEGLSREQFRVFEDGNLQQVARFEPAADAPVRAALLIDRSASMAPHLGRVVEAARGFATAALATPEDRVAVFSFSAGLTVDAGFGAAAGALERALAGLVAGGRTAFYDGLVQALNTLQGESGPGAQALVLYTDGRDEISRLSFDQALETARRAGATLYAVGLEAAFPDRAARREIERLAAETGGRALFFESLDELPGVYLGILDELRARYLLAYEPPAGGTGYRAVEVSVDVPGARVRSRKGYLP